MLVPLGWDDRAEARFASTSDPSHEPGRVVRVDYDRVLVATAAGQVQAPAWPLPATGDWVCLQDGEVAQVLPRWSALVRGEQVLAANVDVVLVVAALDKPLNLNRVERELVLAWDSGARPVVLLTKADATDDPGAAVDALESRCVGVDVLLTSAERGSGIDDVGAQLLPNRTAVFLGPSGAGKSTLANGLLGEDLLATGEVRASDRKGRHTTATRNLIVVPGGGVLIDTPGLRSLSVVGAGDGVARAFPDIDDLAESCKFRDCRHNGEPGCAVADAVDTGGLDPARVANYRKIERDLQRLERGPLERAEDVRKWKEIHKSLRHLDKRQGS